MLVSGKRMVSMENERTVILDRLMEGHYDFNELALRIFHFQYLHNGLYHDFCDHLCKNPRNTNKWNQIPFLPIRFFKSHEVKTGNFIPELIFKSSGTIETVRSRHMVRDKELYKKNSVRIFENTYGPLDDCIILALLPNYEEQGDSSLIIMIRSFMEKTNQPESRFYRYNFEELKDNFDSLRHSSNKIILWGVTFALLDFAELYELNMEDYIVMETGGMKGRREEMIRSEVHQILKSRWNCKQIHSEYGMTELLSQAYSNGKGVFQMNDTMKVLAFDVLDPLTDVGDGTTGRCHVIDLANVDSCSFIATDDLCNISADSFTVAGRLDNSEVRGCNLLYP